MHFNKLKISTVHLSTKNTLARVENGKQGGEWVEARENNKQIAIEH